MISHEHRCIFTHVPKTAGKSIRYMFGLPEFEHEYTEDKRRFDCAFGHKPLAELANEAYFSRYFKFAFVRNPFDRIVSAYFYLENGGCNATDRQFREEHLVPYNGSFFAFVEDLPKFLAAPHFRPQASWLCNNQGKLLTDFVGRYERLHSDLSIVGARLGLPFGGMPFLNASKHNAFRSYYGDAATIRRIALAYGDDLELFSYGLT